MKKIKNTALPKNSFQSDINADICCHTFQKDVHYQAAGMSANREGPVLDSTKQ